MQIRTGKTIGRTPVCGRCLALPNPHCPLCQEGAWGPGIAQMLPNAGSCTISPAEGPACCMQLGVYVGLPPYYMYRHCAVPRTPHS